MRITCGKCGKVPEAKLDRAGTFKVVATITEKGTDRVLEEHRLCPECYEHLVTEGKAEWIEMLETFLPT